MREVSARVEKKFGVSLEPEVRRSSNSSKLCPLLMSTPSATLFISAPGTAINSANFGMRGTGRLSTQKYPISSIRKERARLGFLKRRADYLIDTSHMLTRELKRELNKIYIQNKEYKNLYITVLSFGFKYGIPSDADLVFDVRFLPNPYYML